MNQDFFQNQDHDKKQAEAVFFDAPIKKNAKYYRAQARTKMKPVLGMMILVTFLAMLLGGIGGGSGVSFDFNFSTEESEEVALPTTEAEALDMLGMSAEQVELIVAIVIAVTVFIILCSIALALFVSSPVKLGYQRFLLETVDENAPALNVPTLFRFFKSGYLKSIRLNFFHSLIHFATQLPLIASLVIGTLVFTNSVSLADLSSPDVLLPAVLIFGAIVFTGALISLVIALPVTYMYEFAYLIMADCPTVTAIEALRASRNLMKGHKWQLFCLDFSFIGWYLLAAIFTCGIGMLFVTPYHYTSRALFYHDIAQRKNAKEVEFPSIDPDEGDVAETVSVPSQAPIQEERSDSPDGISAESLEKLEFPSMDLDADE